MHQPGNSYMNMLFSVMQQTAIDRQEKLAAEHRSQMAEQRIQLLQRDMEIQLLKQKAEQDQSAERARNNQLHDANLKAMWDLFSNINPR